MSPVYRKSVFCADVTVGQELHEVFCVASVERRTGKTGTPFLRMTLLDRSGTLAGVAWDEIDRLLEVLVEGEFARLRGRVDTYNEAPQLKVESAEAVREELDLADFLPRGTIPGEESVARIRELAGTMKDANLRSLILSFLDDRAFTRVFADAPAAKVNHHAYVGGLAEHTHSLMRLCDLACVHYTDLDRDLLLAGAFFHDIGKTRELAVQPGFPYTEEGALVGHIALGFAMVDGRMERTPGFPTERRTDLGHMILSHQGELEWGSPVQPQTMEAMTLHYLDNLDAKLATARPHLAGVESGRTSYVRSLGRALFRRGGAPEGEEGSATAPGPGDAPPAGPTLFDGPGR